MRKFIIPFFLILVFIYPLNSFELKEVLTIGSEKPHYEFFSIIGVDTDKDGNIYIADGKGCFIRKYSKDGKFITETGKKGQGPGDFSGSIRIAVGRVKVYVEDSRNKRIAIYNLDLKREPEYVKTNNIFYPTSFFYMNGLLYLTKLLSLEQEKADYEKRIVGVKIESSGIKIVYSFFDKFPDFYKKGKKGKMELALFMTYSILKSAGDEKRDEVVSTFIFPEKDITLYYYSGDGKFLREQSFEILKNYKFPKFLLKFPRKYPRKYTLLMVDSLHYYKDKYIILNYKISKDEKINNKRKSEDSSYIIVIDINKGKIIDKKKIPSGLRIFKIKGDYLYAKNFDDDIEKLHVYKIEGIE